MRRFVVYQDLLLLEEVRSKMQFSAPDEEQVWKEIVDVLNAEKVSKPPTII